MKVLNYTTSYFAAILLVIISLWAAIFYYAMLDEIYDSIDDGLDNQKGLIIKKAQVDSTILLKEKFEEGDYAIRQVDSLTSSNFRDLYVDTSMYMQNENDFEPVRLLRTAFQLNGRYYQMEVITSMVEEDDLTAELFYALLWLYIGLVATILILNNFLLKRIWRPFYHLLKQLKIFRLEDPAGFSVKKTKIDEFRLLNQAVEKLIRSNIESYNTQKQFIENASHELQTPLAISINKLEALAESEKLSEAELKLLGSALDNLERLTRLNKSLLLLSRIANKQFVEKEEVQLNTIVKNIVTDFADQLNYKQLNIVVDDGESLSLDMNRDLAMILVTNLIKNAMLHNVPGGKINVNIHKRSLRVENTGKPEPLDNQKLFTRFNTDRHSESSTGLGLAIVKAIADLYDYQVSYEYNGGHVITISFN